MDELRTKQYKIITVLIGLALLTVCCVFIIIPAQAITLITGGYMVISP